MKIKMKVTRIDTTEDGKSKVVYRDKEVKEKKKGESNRSEKKPG